MNYNEKILFFLEFGEAKAIHCVDLARMMNTDGRTVRAAVLAARIEGTPVLSTDLGYFLPDLQNGEQESERFIASQTRRAKTSFISIRAAKNYLRELRDEVNT